MIATQSLALNIITPAETLLAVREVAWVQVELVDGYLSIWPGHAPLLGETATGPVRYALNADPSRPQSIKLSAGVLQIEPGAVTILTSDYDA